MASSRYGTRGRGISAGALTARIAAHERRATQDAETAPERAHFRNRVRRAQLQSRIARGTDGGFYTAEDIAHARAALARLDAEPTPAVATAPQSMSEVPHRM